MMKKTFILISILILLSCKEDSEKEIIKGEAYTISGLVDENYSDYIYLRYSDVLDSSRVKEGSFEFLGKVNDTVLASLSLERDKSGADFYIENSNIILKTVINQISDSIGNSDQHLKITDIQGSYSEKIRKDYSLFYQTHKDKDSFPNLLYVKLNALIEGNRSHPFSGGILAGNAVMTPIFSQRQLIDLYSKLDTTRMEKSDLSLIKKAIINLSSFRVGTPFLDFKLPDQENNQVDINSTYAAYTLVDFWASWCAPCRKTNPKLVRLKKDLKKNDFEIVSISIDENKERWLRAIEKDSLYWINLIDQNLDVYKKLGIPAIPYSFLTDQNGVIIKINPNPSDVRRIVKEKPEGNNI